MTHQYSRAERLLTRPFPTGPANKQASPSSPLATNGQGPNKRKGKEREASPSPSKQTRLPVGPGGMIEVPDEMEENVSRLVDMSVACRYLAAQCQVLPTFFLSFFLSFYLFRDLPDALELLMSFRCARGIGRRRWRFWESLIRSEILVSRIHQFMWDRVPNRD